MSGGQALVAALVVVGYMFVFALARSSRMRDDYERASHARLLAELARLEYEDLDPWESDERDVWAVDMYERRN